MTHTPDALVIGAGPNGLVAANRLADAGLAVVVLEAEPEPGGAVRSGELTVPGFCHDRFSAFYPLAAASPALRDLALEEHGLVWRRAPAALAHVFPDGRAAVLHADVERTVASVESFARGDGDAWRSLFDRWQRTAVPLVGALLEPFPPVAPALRLGVRLRRPRELRDFVRLVTQPVRSFAQEHFDGRGATMLLAGNTLHTDLAPEATLGAFYGWLLAMLAQSVGFPVPQGGSGALTAALVHRLESRGGMVRCNTRVVDIVVRSGRAVAVRTVTGEEIPAPHGIIADVVATKLFRDLVERQHLPAGFLQALRGFELDNGTYKVDWALRAPVPWTDAGARQAGTVHVGDDLDHLTRFAAELAVGDVPLDPFILFGQMNVADPTRSPPGTETAWAYTHVPNVAVRPDAAKLIERRRDELADRMEEAIERRAPGFRDLIIGRYVQTPRDLEAADANLEGGAVNGGTAQMHQQLFLRPAFGATPTTPIRGLYLGSASAHPGGGVHGACGANAARALLRAYRRRGGRAPRRRA